MNIIKRNDININEGEVKRLLGAGNGRMSSRTSATLDRQIVRVKDISNAGIVYALKGIREIDKGMVVLDDGTPLKSAKLARTLKGCEKVAVFIATIGGKLDSEINTLMDDGKFSDAYVMDAVGSTAVESVVESFHEMMEEKASDKNETTTLRFSPGYCDWPLQEQKKIFRIIDNDIIDVQLTNECLMTPRKSVSGIFGLGKKEVIGERDRNPCRMCGMKKCIARRS